MNRNLTILGLFILSPLMAIWGQSNYKRGYMITRQNDTIRGEIKFRNNTQNYESCLFKTANGEKEYSPDEIKAFGYDGDKTYEAGIVDGAFVERLVTGDLSLYKFEKVYYLKKGTTLKVLESDIQVIEIDGKMVRKETSRWKGILAYMLSDCLPRTQKMVSKIKLTEKSLVNPVIKYNNCKGSDFTEYKSEKPWTSFNGGIAVGMINSTLKINGNDNSLNYFADAYTASSPSAGLVLGISSPRISENLALQTEVHFSRGLFQGIYNRSTSPYAPLYDLTIENSTLSLPVSVKYTIPKKGFGYFFQGGINYDYTLSNDVNLRIESKRGLNTIETTVVEQPFSMEGSLLGFWGGLGAMKSLKRFDVSLSLRYFTMSSADFQDNYYDLELSSKSSQFTLNLIIEFNENTF